jgi:hypothetical protein
MKKTAFIIIISVFTFACSSKKGFLERSNSDKALQDAIKKLNKNPDDQEATVAIPQLYKMIQIKHLDKIKAVNLSQQYNKWDDLLNEYQLLQDAYNCIINSVPAYKLVTPESYATKIYETKDQGAAAYYEQGLTYFNQAGRANAMAAYKSFKQTEKFVIGYKDVNEKLRQAFQNATVTVVINPVQNNVNTFNSGWANSGNNYSNQYFQLNLLNDLNNNNTNPAVFYNSKEAQKINIRPDWTVDFTLKSLDIPNPSNTYSSRTVSNSIQIGTDTSGRPVYNKVYATINTTTSSFVAKGNMEMTIYDVVFNKNISNRNYSQDYKWVLETATFSGDKRALSNTDWNIINNAGADAPRKEEVLVEIYKKIYTSVLYEIRNAVKL